MNPQKIAGSILDCRASGFAVDLASRLILVDRVRKPLLSLSEKWIGYYSAKQDKRAGMTPRIIKEKQLAMRAILNSIDQAVEKGYLSRDLIRTIMPLWGKALCASEAAGSASRRFKEEHGCEPPGLIAISPGHACNLRCRGCYAASDGMSSKLQWSTVDRIITEAKESWGIFLVVLTGGEPLAYRSEDKDVIDLMEKHQDLLFLIFTNGTLLDEAMVQRMAKVNNMTTALSVEGMRSTTDGIRGEGIFDRVVEALGRMHEAGVTVGISATATRFNCEEILSDEFLDFFFNDLGAFYGFIFQYMPIGRSGDTGMMPTPEQRLWMWRRGWEVVEKKKLFLFDFWNYGTIVHGCVSAGRQKGYMHIDWDGNITPCVFAPYSVGNINKLYSQGGQLDDVWSSPFFQAIRGWQRERGFERGSLRDEDNWLMPCPIRDHHMQFKQWLDEYEPQAEPGMISPNLDEELFHSELIQYGDELRNVFGPIWRKEYLGKP
ncbi:MAG: hypothetical protein A2V52_06555 [Actinobacteria bacterium RBG_19FT_COMBO_54_7]|uniref:Radical SAM core domain-containing protein n=1 Tax=Candidatus Solincola sediminis TaxID=1797199 RepID=A0A1F2WKW0_9ACTN|nr:MAG: hypothetical protein A2Y75_00940 [Candidatus Solincola sediminis]OFW66178.1 MAG: hypothetical protein A2V52_06555 [Actinobacteria bacterium RBG_19FT_COMBO_54_7]